MRLKTFGAIMIQAFGLGNYARMIDEQRQSLDLIKQATQTINPVKSVAACVDQASNEAAEFRDA